MKRLALLLLSLAPACSSSPALPPDFGTGGAGGAAGATVKPMNCPDSGGPVDPTALIDDMEAGGAALLMEAGRNGSWWAGGDTPSQATGATIVPNGDAASEVIPNGNR